MSRVGTKFEVRGPHLPLDAKSSLIPPGQGENKTKRKHKQQEFLYTVLRCFLPSGGVFIDK